MNDGQAKPPTKASNARYVAVEELLSEAALEVPIELYGGHSWPGQDLPLAKGVEDEQEMVELNSKSVPRADVDMRELSALTRWQLLKNQVLLDLGRRYYSWEDMRTPLPLGLQYAYDLVERQTSYWWPENGPARRHVTWSAYLATVLEVARFLAGETPEMLRMEVEGADEVDLAAAAVSVATERAKLAVAHSLLASTDEEELPLRPAPDWNANVSFGVVTNEARARMVKEYVLFRVQGKETFTFRGLRAPMSSAWDIAWFVCERQIVLHKYQKCTWGELVTALNRIVEVLTSEEMKDPDPETATKLCEHSVRVAAAILGGFKDEVRFYDVKPSPRDVDAMRAKITSFLNKGDQRAQLSEQAYRDVADRVSQEAEASKARGDPEEVYGQLFLDAAFLAYFGDNVLFYLKDLGASRSLLTQLIEQAMEVTQVFRNHMQTKSLPSAELEATLRLAANRVALHAPTAKQMVADDRPTDFKTLMTREVATLINSDEGMGAVALKRMLAWAKNTIVPEWMKKSNAAGARSHMGASYKIAGADEPMLSRLDEAIQSEKSFKGPFQTFRDTGKRRANYTLSPVNAEKRMWLCRGNVIQGYVAEYNDGYLGFGHAFTEDVPNGSKGHASFESRSGLGIAEAELYERATAQNLVTVADNVILRELLTPIMGGSDAELSGLWFYPFLEQEGMLMFVLDSRANGLLARRVRGKHVDVFIPIAAVFPAIQAVIYSGGDANALNRDSKYGGLSPHRDEPDMRVHVDKVDFYTYNTRSDNLVIWQRMEFLEWSFLTTSGAVKDRRSDPGYRVPVAIADCVLGAYCHFMPTKKVDSQVAPAQVSRTLVSLVRPDEEGYSEILPGFKKAVLDGKIVCELHVDMFRSEPDGIDHEMFCTVRWLDSPPTLSGTEYALTILPGDDRMSEPSDADYGAEVSTGEELREVTWVPGFDMICVMKEGLDTDVYEWFQETIGTEKLADVPIMHNDNFIPGQQPSNRSKCDPRVRLAMAKWDKDHKERKGLEWWRHMERERLNYNCPRRVWMKAWGEYIVEEVEEQALRIKKKKERDERTQKEAKRKALEEKAKKEQRDQQAAQQREEKLARERALAAQREEEEWRSKAQAQGDMAVETMLKEEAEREVLLWKRAALQLAEELNKKWDQAILDEVKAAKNQVAQDRATERSKAGQDAANARKAAREEKERKAREERERKAEEAAARKAAFQAEKEKRAKEKAKGAAAGAYRDQPKGKR